MWSSLIQLRLILGDREGALRAARDGSVEPDDGLSSYMHLLYGRAVLREHEGDPEGALEDLRAAGERQEAGNCDNPSMIAWRSRAAHALVALGRPGEGRELAEEELDLALRFGAPGAVGTARAAVAACVHEPAERIALLREACAEHERGEKAHHRIAALIALGRELISVRDPVAAREPLLEALDIASAGGAVGVAAETRELLRAAGARPRRTAVRGPNALTPSERRVAALAADGATNLEIAHALFIAPKTVEWHLSSVYRKLNVRRRRELADVMHTP